MFVSSDVKSGENFQYYYDAIGQLTRVVDSVGNEVEYVYDRAGNVIEVQRRAAPTLAIYDFEPRTAPVGASIRVRGLGFSSNSAQNHVSFTGSSTASLLTSAPTYLELIVPNGALSGPVTVAVDAVGSAVSSSSFSVAEETSCPMDPSLVGWWSGEGNTMDSVGGNNGLGTGTTFAPGFIGQSFDFHASGDFVSISESPLFDFQDGTSFTVELWAFRRQPGFPQHLMGKRNGCGGGSFYQVAIGTSAIPDSSVPLFTWVHLVLTYDGASARVEEFVDGILVESRLHGSISNDAELRIGGSGDCSGFDGLVDEVKIYNRALLAGEIQAHFLSGQVSGCP